MTRVLVTEESAVTRMLLVSILDGDPAVKVVGQAVNGRQAVELAARLRPDVITMGVNMPVMDGVEATRQIMERTPTPIVFVSDNDPRDVRRSFKALEAGALAVLGKPRGPGSPDFAQRSVELCGTVKAMCVITRRPLAGAPAGVTAPAARPPASPTRPAFAPPTPLGDAEPPDREQRRIDMLAIGSSTGGPAALAKVLSNLPSTIPVPVLIVQHIAQGFDAGLAEWLNGISPLRVSLAADGRPMRPGEVLIAPYDVHLGVSSSNRTAVLGPGPLVDGHRPSASHLFTSVARAYGRHALGVVLTGMGEDGASGLVHIQEAGGWVLSQDEASCVVYGMPAAAVARGVVNRVLPLDGMAQGILGALRRGRV